MLASTARIRTTTGAAAATTSTFSEPTGAFAATTGIPTFTTSAGHTTSISRAIPSTPT